MEDVEPAVGRILRMKREAEQPFLTAGTHLAAEIEERTDLIVGQLECLQDPGLFDDEQPLRIAGRSRHEHRRTQPADNASGRDTTGKSRWDRKRSDGENR